MTELILGDCLEKMRQIKSESIDSLVTDPPAGIGFMGKSWDSNKGGRDHWIKWMSDVMRECHRVLKPGAHGLVWSLPRTSHWTAMALEDAGFEIRDCVSHLFGSGFPKSLNISKAIDKAAGAEREVIGPKKDSDGRIRAIEPMSDKIKIANGRTLQNSITKPSGNFETIPSTNDAKQWDGWGTALKPAVEFWWLVRKPLSEKTVAENVLKWGTGGINVDGCRIGTEKRHPGNYIDKKENKNETKWGHKSSDRSEFNSNQGRFPSNLVLSHSPYCTDEQCEEKIISYPIVCVGTNQLSPFDNYQTSLEFLFHVSLETRGYSKNDNDLLRNGVFSFGNADKKLSYSLLDDVLHEQLSSSALDSLDYYRTCLHFYDEQFHRVLKAAQESVPSLIDALERVYADLQQLPHSHDRRNSFSLFLWASFFISSKYYPDFITTKSNVIKESSCAIALLDEQSGNIKSAGKYSDIKNAKQGGNGCFAGGRLTNDYAGESGGASRFFYCAKTSTSERNAGLDGTKNGHPTVKPQKLMRYFCRLVTPPNGIILDPFMGSGSTGLAAKSEGFKFIGIEQNEEYFEIARKRIL